MCVINNVQLFQVAEMAVTKKPAPKKGQLNQKTGKKGIKGGKIRGKGIKRKINLKFMIDCTHPTEDSILDVGNFEKYLKERVKVEGKTNNLGNHVVIARDKTKITINAGKLSCIPIVFQLETNYFIAKFQQCEHLFFMSCRCGTCVSLLCQFGFIDLMKAFLLLILLKSALFIIYVVPSV